MANKVYRYRNKGITADDVTSGVGIAPVAITALVPATYVDVTFDENQLPGLDEWMLAERNFERVETDPPAMSTVGIQQIQDVQTTADSPSILVASGWTDVAPATGPALSVTLSSRGGTRCGIVVSCVNASISVGAQVRALINGGAFTNQPIDPVVSFPLVVGGSACVTIPFSLPSTANRTTYTVRIQARGVGVLAAVSIAARSSLTVFEYAQ